jgi:SET domain-containing protein
MKPGSASTADPISDTHIKVRHSTIHGNGVFATRKIPAGARIIEYQGKRITEKQAEKRFGLDPENPYHTFFFSLENGKLIDGGDEGNDARWINHSCEPNCEAQEEKGRVFIHALRDIARGEELNYDYGLVIDEKMTKTLKKAYECRCGSADCRGTMLALKRKAAPAANKAAKPGTKKATKKAEKADKKAAAK